MHFEDVMTKSPVRTCAQCGAQVSRRATICLSCSRKQNLKGLPGDKNSNWGKFKSTDPDKGRKATRKRIPLGPCERCGKPGTELHHIDNNPFNFAPTNVMSVCRRCHMVLDGRLQNLKQYQMQANMNRPTLSNPPTIEETIAYDKWCKAEIEANTAAQKSGRKPFRGHYGEIPLHTLYNETQEQIRLLVAAAGSASKIDEHGSWSFGVESNRKGRCEALSWDLYGLGNDAHTGKFLVAIQIRQFFRRKEGYFPRIRKNYFMLGHNEDNSVFAHSVPSAVIHSAIRRDADVITAIQNWIFDCDYAHVLRQGDLALLPCSRRPSAPRIAKRTALIEKSHALKASALRQAGEGAEAQLFAKNPNLKHLPGTHPEVQGENRWYKVMVGQRADFWKFAAPTID